MLLRLSFFVLVAMSVSCKSTSTGSSEALGVLSPDEFSEAEPITKDLPVQYYWADDSKVYAITCYPRVDSVSVKHGAYFSTVEDCKEKFSATIRSMTVEQFKEAARGFYGHAKFASNAFEARKTLDEVTYADLNKIEQTISQLQQAGKVDEATEQKARLKQLQKDLALAHKLYIRHAVAVTADFETFLDNLMIELRRSDSLAMQGLQEFLKGENFDLALYRVYMARTVGRLIPDKIVEVGHPAICAYRPKDSLIDGDYAFALLPVEESCETYGFELARGSDIMFNDDASKFFRDHTKNVAIPDEQEPWRIWGGGRLLTVRINSTAEHGTIAVRGMDVNNFNEFNYSNVSFFKRGQLDNRFAPQQRLCRRIEATLQGWSPCPKTTMP